MIKWHPIKLGTVKGRNTMKNIIMQVLKTLFVLAVMTIGFIFVGAFVEYKTMNGANIYAGLTFAVILCTVISAMTFEAIKETVLNEVYKS